MGPSSAEHGDCILHTDHTPEQMAAVLAQMDGVIAMRLHAVVLGALSNVPAFGLVYDPKVRWFMEQAGMSHGANLDELRESPDQVTDKLKVWIADLDRQSRRMRPAIDGMIQKERRNVEVAVELIQGRFGP